jgi:ABC-2 type transport system permease protein
MNNRTMAVIRREFTTRVMTKTFIISTILVPVMILIIAVVPSLLFSGGDHTTRIAVVDGTAGQLGTQIERVLDAQRIGQGAQAIPRYDVHVVPAHGHAQAARDKLIDQTGFSRDDAKGRYDGVLVLPSDVLTTGRLTYYGSNASSLPAMRRLQGSLSKAFAGTRLADAGISVDLVAKAMRPVNMNATKVTNGKLTGQSGEAAFFVAYGMGILLYMAILLFGQRTMTSVIEEKTTRVVEVLVSSLTPFQLMLGKVVGVGAAGLLQMAILGVSAWIITSQGAHIATFFGASPDTLSAFALPHIGAGLVAVFLLYFVLGYLIYGALYAAIGSICNTVQDSQQYAIVVTMLILIGFFASFSAISHPDGTIAHALSWIPFFAPFVMPVRWSLTSVSAVDLAGSLALMVLGTLFCVWLAARIYHTGILMFGKKPSWRELWRWVRAS